MNAVRLLQLDNRFKDLPPLLVAGKVIVGEKIESDARLPVIRLNSVRNSLRVTHAHLPSLHIDNRAEAATEWTPTATINGAKLFVGKAPQILFVNHGDRGRVQVRSGLEKIIQWLQFSKQHIAQQVFPL